MSFTLPKTQKTVVTFSKSKMSPQKWENPRKKITNTIKRPTIKNIIRTRLAFNDILGVLESNKKSQNTDV